MKLAKLSSRSLTHLLWLTLFWCCAAADSPPATEVEGPPEDLKLPTGAEVLDRHIAASGGKEAHRKLKTRFEQGVYAFPPDGEEGPFMAYAAAPYFYYKRLNAGSRGTLINGSNGQVFWTIHPADGARIQSGKDHDASLRELYFHRDLNWRDLYTDALCEDLVEFRGAECYLVILTANNGDKVTRFYAKDTGLFAGSQMEIVGSVGSFVAVTIVSDYRETQGVLVPFKMRQELGGLGLDISFDRIEFNVDIRKDRFELPAELRDQETPSENRAAPTSDGTNP